MVRFHPRSLVKLFMENFENINNEDLKKLRRKLREDKPVITERSVEEYESLFDVKFSEMKGKTILDIGSGRGNFHDRVSALGVKVFSLNPEFKRGKEAKSAEKIIHAEGDVGARAQEMPFADNSFDSEFALYSVPYYLPRYEEIGESSENSEKFFYEEFERVIDEIIRTLKPGGKAYIYPLYPLGNINGNIAIAEKILKERSDKVAPDYGDFEGNRLLVLTKK